MTRYRLLVNPASGGGRAAAAAEPVRQLLVDAGASAAVTVTRSAVDGARAAAEAVQAGEVVVAVGGDGMLASVAGAVVAGDGVLGIVPGGRGNDFARQLGLPNSPDAAARCLLRAETRRVDVIDAGGRIVLGSVYAGIDSRSSEYVDGARRLPRATQYPYAAVRAILTHRPTRYLLTVDGVAHELDAYTAVVANSGYYGQGMHIVPDAAVDDGRLDVVVIPAGPRRRLLLSLRKVYDGSHVRDGLVHTFAGERVSISTVTPVTAYGDGERIGPLPITAQVRPGALAVLV